MALCNKGNRATPLFNYNHYLRRWEMPDLVGHDGKRVGSDNKTDGMNRHIYRLVAAVLAAMTIVSCNDARRSETYRLLEDVDSYIEARPDSALAVLEGIDKSELTSKELEAKYALLLSQALDKNYIDLQSDSIIAPAVRYYENHGTPDERLKMYYYSGRIKQNSGDYEGAMERFVKGESYGDECTDKALLGRLYAAKQYVYQETINYTSAIPNAQLAADAFLEAEDVHNYLLKINDLAILYQLTHDEAKHAECMNIIKENWDILTDKHKSHYYTILLNPYSNAENPDELISEYLSEVKDSSLIIWSGLSNVYLRLNQPESALQVLEYSLKYNQGEKDAAYYFAQASAYEQLGESDEALAAYKKYVEITDANDLEILKADTKFIEERHKKEIELLDAEHSKERIMFISIIAILCAVIIIYLIRKQLQIRTAEKKQLEIEKKRYEQLYADATAERDALTKMIEDSSVKDETKAVIRERLEVLNKVIISHITDTSRDNRKAYEELEALISDRASFLESTKKTIENINQDFVSYLVSKGLTESEVNLCCLYAIGMKGKDIKDYTATASVYKDSSVIRQKLGLMENDTNLSNYLQDLLKMPSGKLL